MKNDGLFKFVKKKFEEEDNCEGCSSQRCDGSYEWMSGCPKFQAFFNTTIHPPIVIDEEKINRLMKDIDAVDIFSEEESYE